MSCSVACHSRGTIAYGGNQGSSRTWSTGGTWAPVGDLFHPSGGLSSTGTCYLDLSTFQPGSLSQTWDLELRMLSSPQGSESLQHPVFTEESG